MIEKNLDANLNELEEKIVDLSLKLKNAKSELKGTHEEQSNLIRKISHNLKNSIGSVYSFSGIMLNDIENYPIEKLEKHLQIIRNSAEFSIKFLDSLTKYAHLQSSAYKFNYQTKEYIHLVKEVVDELMNDALSKEINIETNFPDKELFLELDELEIKRALNNIIHNAVRYSNSNSTIYISIIENKETIETTIKDEGIGVPENEIQHILKEFYAVNTYSGDKEKCIGLGLTIADEVIKKHKGKILIASVLNEGTTIKIVLDKTF